MITLIISSLYSISVAQPKPLKKHEFVLETLPISPFVEKVRWSLDRLGVSYVEEQDYGVVMFFRGLSVPNLYCKI
jgi:hypothetical protein